VIPPIWGRLDYVVLGQFDGTMERFFVGFGLKPPSASVIFIVEACSASSEQSTLCMTLVLLYVRADSKAWVGILLLGLVAPDPIQSYVVLSASPSSYPCTFISLKACHPF
jgi:hypothetical protein